MASAHILQCLKIGILLLAKIVNGMLLYGRRQKGSCQNRLKESLKI